MKSNKSWERLARFFAGELSPEDDKKMKSWIEADPNREEEVNRLYEIWQETGNLPSEVDVDQAWLNVASGMDEIERSKRKKASRISAGSSLYSLPVSQKNIEKGNRPGIVWRRLALVAATVLVVSLAGFFSVYTHRSANLAEAPTIENRVFITKNGERATYILNDGSKVMLHAGSRLEIPENYNTGDRRLFLEGEAYFEVTHDEDSPFIVHSQHAYTRVLGTRFLVQAWPEAVARVEVVVSEGKVAFGQSREGVTNPNNEVFITSNEMGVVDEGRKPMVTRVTDLDWHMGWTEGRLEFENRPLQEVLRRLERWYNIEIRVEEEQIHQRKITAVIDYSQPMSEVIQGIALTHELEVDKKGRIYTFRAPE